MPVMDGYQAAEEIRMLENEAGSDRIPILAITAHAMSGHRERCIDSGMDDQVTKPLQLNVLRDAIEHCIDKKTLRV